MDLWNRLFVSLVAMFLMAGAIVTLLVAANAVAPDFLPGGSGDQAWFYSELRGVDRFGGAGQTVTIVASIAVGLVMLAVFFLELISLRRKPALLPISSTSNGVLNIEESSVRLLAERVGASNRNVSSLRCRLRKGRRPPVGGPASITISCYPRVVLGSNVPEVRDDLQTRIKDAVQQLTGLNVLQVNVMRVRYDRADDSRLLGG